MTDALKPTPARVIYNPLGPFPYVPDDVSWLASELNSRDMGEKIVVGEPYLFGLALDVYDPVSGQVFTVATPQRRDIGQQAIYLTPDQVAAEVASARAARLNQNRLHGIISDADKAANEKNLAAERAAQDEAKAKSKAA